MFTDPVSQVYPFVLVVLLVINLVTAKALDSWEEQKEREAHSRCKKGGDAMVTCSVLIQFCIFVIVLVSLCYKIFRSK